MEETEPTPHAEPAITVKTLAVLIAPAVVFTAFAAWELAVSLAQGSSALRLDALHNCVDGFFMGGNAITFCWSSRNCTSAFTFTKWSSGIIIVLTGTSAAVSLLPGLPHQNLDPGNDLVVFAAFSLAFNLAFAALSHGGLHPEHGGQDHRDQSRKATFFHLTVDTMAAAIALAALTAINHGAATILDPAASVIGAALIAVGHLWLMADAEQGFNRHYQHVHDPAHHH